MLHLVGLIYAGATNAGMAGEALRLLNEHLGGVMAQMFTIHLASGAVLNSQVSDSASKEVHQEYVNHWTQLDPHTQLLLSLPAGKVLRCHERFDPQFVAASSFHQEFFLPRGFRWAMGGMYQGSAGTASVIAAVRGPDAPAFDDWAAAALRQLLPHFERAALLGSSLARQTGAIQSATRILKLLPTPCLFTDEAGRCIEANDAFTQSVEPLSLRVVTGRVRFTQQDMQSRWETALFETQATALGRTLLATSPGGRQWKVHLIPWHPLAQQADARDKHLILVVFDEKIVELPAQSTASVKARLTRAEVEVLAGLLKGLPAKTIATRRSASVNTVRSQIVAILDKTGYNSQKELIASFGASALPDSAFASSRLLS